jgi:hypothetical protein
MSFPFDSDRMDTHIDYADDNNNLGDGLYIGVDVISAALEAFTSAIIDFESTHYAMAHYINSHVIISDRFNEIVSLLIKMELDPSKQSLVTHQYIVQCILSDDNYTFVEYVSTVRGEKQRKPRSAERGASRVDNARYHYLCGITHRRILEHDLAGGDENPSNPTTHEGK